MPSEILSHLPKPVIFEHLEPRFRGLFRVGSMLLETFYKSYDRLLQPPDEFFIDYLLAQARDYHASALGYMLDQQCARSIGDERLEKRSTKLAENRQSLALIFSDAADRANTFGGSPQNERVAEKVSFIQQRVSENSFDPAVTGDLLRMFQTERERGFRIPARNAPLVTVIGDEGCGDTADVMRVTNAYRIPVDLLVINERHNDRQGFRRSNDHAIALYQDLYGSPRIPCVVFPNDAQMSEPSMHQFTMALFENNMI